jgi:phosphate transport system permease protein
VFVGLTRAAGVASTNVAPVVRDRIASVAVHSAGAAMLDRARRRSSAYTLWRGREALPHLNFFTHGHVPMPDRSSPCRSVASPHAIVGTLIMISIRPGHRRAARTRLRVYLNETTRRLQPLRADTVGRGDDRAARRSSRACSSTRRCPSPSAWQRKSGIAAGLAHQLEICSSITYNARCGCWWAVSGSTARGVLRLWAPRPGARHGTWCCRPRGPALTTAVILGTARGIGEAAPVL